jgi:hypothetical protein
MVLIACFIQIEFAFSETVNPDYGIVPSIWRGYNSPQSYCDVYASPKGVPGVAAPYPAGGPVSSSSYNCVYGTPGVGVWGGSGSYSPSCPSGYGLYVKSKDSLVVCKSTEPNTCPENQGWFLSPDDNKCHRPDCIGDQYRDPQNGFCECEKGRFLYEFNSEQAASVAAGGCANGCFIPTQSMFGACPGGLLAMFHITDGPVTCYSYLERSGEVCYPQGEAASDRPKTPGRSIDAELAPPSPPPTDKPGQAPDGTPDDKNTQDNAKDIISCAKAGGNYVVSGGKGNCLSSQNVPPEKRDATIEGTPKPTTIPGDDGGNSPGIIPGTTVRPSDGNGPTGIQDLPPYVPPTFTSNPPCVKDCPESPNPGGSDPGSDPGGSTGGGGSGSSGSGDGQCAKEPNSPMCRTGVVGAKGHFSDNSGKVEAATKEFQDYFDSIRNKISDMVGQGATPGGGSLPCRQFSAFGRDMSICLDKYADDLAIIGIMVMLAATLMSAFIIFR